MYDPDQPTFVIRFAEVEGKSVGDLAMERAEIEREMQALSLRWTDITEKLTTARAQAQPISAAVMIDNTDFWATKHLTDIATADRTNANARACLRHFEDATKSD